jgi:uncharacterized protein
VRVVALRDLNQLVDDVTRRGPVGVAHRQVDDVLARAARRHLQLVGDVEDVGGQALDAREFGDHGLGRVVHVHVALLQRNKRYDSSRTRRSVKSLKIEREQPEGKNLFTGYGEGYVEVNRQRHASSLVVGAERLVTDWPVDSVEGLAADHLAAIVELKPEVVLLGTGRSFVFPDPRLLAPLHGAKIGVEVMDTAAACRTYNILLGEGRNVVAALIVQ